MTEDPIRILVVDDSVTYRHVLRRVLGSIPGVDVVAVARNGRIALEKLRRHQIDLLTLDLDMPEMNGLELLHSLRTVQRGVATLLVSAFTTEGASATMSALGSGAFDFVLKPNGANPQANEEALRQELAAKIAAFRRTWQIRKILHQEMDSAPHNTQLPKPDALGQTGHEIIGRMRKLAVTPAAAPKAVVLGTSTGGPQALAQVLPRLPKHLPVPVLIVQHMPAVFTRSLADDLNCRCQLAVVEATDAQPLLPGHAYIAPGGKQMKVATSDDIHVARITDDPPENSCRPSVDYLFRSAADVFGGAVLGVIMTGMGNDGAAGCRLLKQYGAPIIAQNEATCVVYGMPREPIEAGLVDVVAPLSDIAAEIVRLVGGHRQVTSRRLPLPPEVST